MSELARIIGIGGPKAPRAIAFVGAGGKTTGLFLLSRLASVGAGQGCTPRVIVTTTTMVFDPRENFPGPVLLDPRLALWPSATASERADILAGVAAALEAAAGKPLFVASQKAGNAGGTRVSGEPAKLKGIASGAACALAALCDLLLVEADGARMLPIKAPGPDEPVVPEIADIVIGVVGADSLGKPMDAATVHRPELFSAVTGCAPGEPVAPAHLAALARAPQGLFKNAPPGARKILALNKADLLGASRQEAEGAARRLADVMAPLLPAGVELAVCSFAQDILYAHAEGRK